MDIVPKDFEAVKETIISAVTGEYENSGDDGKIPTMTLNNHLFGVDLQPLEEDVDLSEVILQMVHNREDILKQLVYASTLKGFVNSLNNVVPWFTSRGLGVFPFAKRPLDKFRLKMKMKNMT